MSERGIYERPPGSGIWWIRYNDEKGKKRRKKVGTSKTLAIKARTKALDRVRAIKLGLALSDEELARRELTFAQLGAKYWPEYERKKSAAWDARSQKRWEEALGSERLIREIVPGDIEAAKAAWLRDFAPGTVNRRLAYLKSLFRKARRDGVLETIPIGDTKVKLEPERTPPRVWLDNREDEASILERLDEFTRLATVFALHTGLRVSEQTSITRRMIRKRRREVEFLDSKGNRAFTIKLNPIAWKALCEVLGLHSSAWAFPGDLDKPIARETLNRRLVRASEACGVYGLTWHGLRHTFISRLVQEGVNLAVVQQMARHSTIEQTMTYAHLAPGDVDQALEILSERYAPEFLG